MPDRSARVLAGVDGSEASRGVVRWAAEEAARHGRRLTILHALGMPQPFGWPVDGSTVLREAAEAARARRPELQVETVLAVGAAGPALAEQAARAALVVVGCRVRSTISGIVLGSVGRFLAGHATCPVLVMHHAERWAGPAQPLPSDGAVAVGLDGSPGSLRALEMAFEQAAARNAPLLILQPSADADATGPLGELALWHAKFPDVEVMVSTRHGRLQAALADASQTATLLVLGGAGHNALPGHRVGRRLVHQAFCPVLIVGEHASNMR